MDLQTLVKKAKEKDTQALGILYRMYYPKMLGLCVRLIKVDEDMAQDLVHDAFVLAFSSLHSLHTPERFGEWLSTIVRNVSLKYMERKRKVEFVPIGNEDRQTTDAGTIPDAVVNGKDILGLVDGLPEGYRNVFRLYVIDGFSHKEIAEILGIGAHSSSSQLTRAKAMLRKMLGRRYPVLLLLLIMVVPVYIFISRERPAQPQLPKMAEARREKHAERKKEKNAGHRPSEAEKGLRNRVPARNTERELSGTMQLPDTAKAGTSMPDMQVEERKSDDVIKSYCVVPSDSVKPSVALPVRGFVAETAKKKRGKWQVLFAGSVGPALAQNIYGLVTSGRSDEIVEGTTHPEYVKTWEDFSNHLHEKVDGYVPADTLAMMQMCRTSTATTAPPVSADTLAMMQIADHNQGDIVEREYHDRPVTFGLSLSKPLSEKWSIETGLQYSILKSRSVMGNENYYIGKKQKIHYLGISSGLAYRIAGFRRVSAYGAAGMSLHIPVYGKVSCEYVVASVRNLTYDRHVRPPVQWSARFSLGLQYRILPKMTLYAEPTLYWHIPNGSATHTVWTEHPVMFSTPFGVRFMW